MDLFQMEPNQVEDMKQIFVESARSRPQRTYSHKVKSNRTFSLPSLKPVPNRNIPKSTSTTSQDIQADNTEAWGQGPELPSRLDEPLALQTDLAEGYGGLVDDDGGTHVHASAAAGIADSLSDAGREDEGVLPRSS